MELLLLNIAIKKEDTLSESGGQVNKVLQEDFVPSSTLESLKIVGGIRLILGSLLARCYLI
jgi:hypothetical protein